MGATNTYRYVTTTSVPNTNSGTYTPSSHGTALDMGATNTYRYVNTTNAYNQGFTNYRNTRSGFCATNLYASGVIRVDLYDVNKGG